MRASRQKRPRMDLMEGRNSLLSPLHFWNSNFSDFLVAGQCRLWSTTKRCTISKIFQPRRQSRLFSASRTFPNSGKLVLKKLQDHSEAGLWKVAQDHSGVWLAVDTGYPLFWPAGPASNYLCTWKLPFRVLTWSYSNENPLKREWKTLNKWENDGRLCWEWNLIAQGQKGSRMIIFGLIINVEINNGCWDWRKLRPSTNHLLCYG